MTTPCRMMRSDSMIEKTVSFPKSGVIPIAFSNAVASFNRLMPSSFPSLMKRRPVPSSCAVNSGRAKPFPCISSSADPVPLTDTLPVPTASSSDSTARHSTLWLTGCRKIWRSVSALTLRKAESPAEYIRNESGASTTLAALLSVKKLALMLAASTRLFSLVCVTFFSPGANV